MLIVESLRALSAAATPGLHKKQEFHDPVTHPSASSNANVFYQVPEHRKCSKIRLIGSTKKSISNVQDLCKFSLLNLSPRKSNVVAYCQQEVSSVKKNKLGYSDIDKKGSTSHFRNDDVTSFEKTLINNTSVQDDDEMTQSVFRTSKIRLAPMNTSFPVKRSNLVQKNAKPFGECFAIAAKLIDKDKKTKKKGNQSADEEDLDEYTAEIVGQGAYGAVQKVYNRLTRQARAAKRIPKEKLKDKAVFENEVECLMDLDHPHIVKLVEYFEEEDEYILIFEFCEGPDLFDFMVKIFLEEGRFDEIRAGRVIRHMLKAGNKSL